MVTAHLLLSSVLIEGVNGKVARPTGVNLFEVRVAHC